MLLLHHLPRLGIALVLVALLAMPPVFVQAQEAEPPDPYQWVSLGPTELGDIERVGVSSDWPADPFLIVDRRVPSVRQGTPPPLLSPPAARSFDGGRTWEALPESPPAGDLIVINTARSGRVLLAGLVGGGPRASDRSADSLSRSDDDGLTWRSVLVSPGNVAVGRLFLSPSVRDDERVLLISRDQAFQSTDLGRSWAAIELPAGQMVSDARYSPAFAQDRTIYLSASTDQFLGPYTDRDPDAPRRHETSAGILRSTDGGATWTNMSEGLRTEAGPYRAVQSLAISPTFDRDGTLFAFAIGPWIVPSNPGYSPGPHYVLFRSRDRGQSWENVWEPYPRTRTEVFTRTYVTLALSPSFVDDGLMLGRALSVNSGPHSGCAYMASNDSGTNWAFRFRMNESVPCGPGRVVSIGSQLGSWYAQGGKPYSDATLLPPETYLWPPMLRWSGYTFPVPTIVADGTAFHPSSTGVWARGPSATHP